MKSIIKINNEIPNTQSASASQNAIINGKGAKVFEFKKVKAEYITDQ